MADGIYIWQVTAATDELIEVEDEGLPRALTNSSTDYHASPGTITINRGTAESGSFRVQNGVILPNSNGNEQ